LKVTPAADDESDEEGDALELWGGDGAVRLLRRDRRRRALLIERARPGDDLATLTDERATAVAVEVGVRLWRPACEPFRWIGDHVPRWLDEADVHELVPLARELYGSFTPGRGTLVHGDFHHHNILDAGGRHLAIDPKPMLGEPEYDRALVPPESLVLPAEARRDRAAARSVRCRRPRRVANACLECDPRRLPRSRRRRSGGHAGAPLSYAG